jgi:hypothetical protein
MAKATYKNIKTPHILNIIIDGLEKHKNAKN